MDITHIVFPFPDSYLRFNRDPVYKMLAYLDDFF